MILCRLDVSKQSPMGYDDFDEVTITRQVVIGGKNKYLINGRTVQQSQVTNLFHSVQLNVNNPHFLIMQASRGLYQGRRAKEATRRLLFVGFVVGT